MSDHGQQVASLVKHVRRIAQYEGITEGQAAVLRAAADELERTKRGAVTLGEIVERQCRDVLDVTGRHDLVDEDGDGDWGAVWDHLYELGGLRERVERLRGLLATWDRIGGNAAMYAAEVRAHLEPGGSQP